MTGHGSPSWGNRDDACGMSFSKFRRLQGDSGEVLQFSIAVAGKGRRKIRPPLDLSLFSVISPSTVQLGRCSRTK